MKKSVEKADGVPAVACIRLLGRVWVMWTNWKNRKTAKAYRTMARALQRDEGYALSWQANIAMPILDGSNGKLTHNEANRIADALMLHLWGVKCRPNDQVERTQKANKGESE